MMEVDSTNLFVRVPHLGLPTALQEFLLYHVSLDEKK